MTTRPAALLRHLHRLAALLVVGLAVAGAGVAAPDEGPKPAAGDRQTRTDRFGDPLPQGALTRLGTVRFRHGNGTTLAFTPDSKTRVSCGADRTIRFWGPASGRQLREQQLPPSSFTPVTVLSPDGRLLAFQDVDSPDAVNLWDVERNRLRHKLPLGERWWYTEVTRVFPVGRFFKPSGRITNPSYKKQPKAGSIQGRLQPRQQYPGDGSGQR